MMYKTSLRLSTLRVKIFLKTIKKYDVLKRLSKPFDQEHHHSTSVAALKRTEFNVLLILWRTSFK